MKSLTIPAKDISQIPKFQFAVFSLRQGESIAELESSFASQQQAEDLFARQYAKWGLPETTFYLVDWAKQIVLQVHDGCACARPS